MMIMVRGIIFLLPPLLISFSALEVPTLGEHTTVAFKDEDDQATVWNIYSKKGEHYDHNFVDDANKTADVILIFVSFST